MNTLPKITVVTVTYNAEKCLEETILSVINQTYPNIEYIVIDGGSKDGTVDIIKKYAEHIDYWVSEPDKGIYDAMNKGIDKATGEWINFMNAGDSFVSEKALEKVFNQDYSEYDFIYGDRVNKDVVGLYIEKANPFWLQKNAYCPWKGGCHQSTFVKTNTARLHKYSLKYKYAGDYEMMYNIYKANGKFKYVNIPIALYNLLEGFSIEGVKAGAMENARLLGVPINFKFKIWIQYRWIRFHLSRFVVRYCGIRLKRKEKFHLNNY